MDSPLQSLTKLSQECKYPINSIEFAQYLDKTDPLKRFRCEFSIPNLPHSISNPVNGDPESQRECIYMCSNSLGLMPNIMRTVINQQLDKWAANACNGRTQEPWPWEEQDKEVSAVCCDIVGAYPDEVVVMNGLSVNLHLLLLSFYKPTSTRYKILVEDKLFPSDAYVLQSQIRLHGFDPNDALVYIKPKDNTNIYCMQDIVDSILSSSNEICVICLPGIQYYTGQLFDIPLITKVGKEAGCIVGWDLAHAVGNVELYLHDWNVDFGCWCTYKYLNCGHGSIGAAFIHSVHEDKIQPTLQGWWGHDLSTRFNMTNEMELAPGAQAFHISNTSFMLVSMLRASLEIFIQAGGVKELRKKSQILTGYLEYLLLSTFSDENLFSIITPRNPDCRGAQLSLHFNPHIDNIMHTLKSQGVICDSRPPNVIRLAPVPLYNTFEECFLCVEALKSACLPFMRNGFCKKKQNGNI